jgi:NAD(P)-dependent dehydrogenase (short-subunit alcohol dehydrogenase family)
MTSDHPAATVKSLMSLEGRRAVITGGAGHIGAAMAKALAELGAGLILVDLRGANFDAATKSLPAQGGAAPVTYGCDLELEAERQRLIAMLLGEDRPIDILINNAAFVGTSGLRGWVVPFEEQTVESWRRAFEVNLTSAFHLCQGLTPLLRKSKGASIINISSIYGHCGPDMRLYEGTKMGNPAAYAASKGGLIQLTRWLATSLAPDIRVNAISPGGIFRNQPESFVERYEARVPLQRMGTEEDLIGATVFLASDLSRYVTGQNICVDGGWSVW